MVPCVYGWGGFSIPPMVPIGGLFGGVGYWFLPVLVFLEEILLPLRISSMRLLSMTPPKNSNLNMLYISPQKNCLEKYM